MRYSASEKFEIIELVEQSSLSIRRTLAPIGIPRSTFYDWYSRYQEGGVEALEDGKPRPQRVWNKIPDEIGTAIVNLALEEPDLSPRELERYHRSMKNRILLENYYLPGQLEHSIGEFVEYYNNCRYHESLDNLTPADVYFGRGPAILKRRQTIKRKTIEQRRRLHQQAIAA